MTITIRLKKNGPYLIASDQAAEVVVLDADGNTLSPEPGRSIALCRCGGSSTKPFCDGTHKRNGFVGTSAPGEPGRSATVPDPTGDDSGSGATLP